MAAQATFPVKVLREHATALEAALSVCLGDPGHKAVHRLRTETRRVEAELLLVTRLPQIPEHRCETKALLKELKRLRRPAGKVRDLDVHRKMLEGYADPEPGGEVDPSGEGGGAKAAGSQRRTAKKRAAKARRAQNEAAPDGKDSASLPEPAVLRQGASDLRAHMGKQRDAGADKLQRLLKKRQGKLARATESLLKVLDQTEEVAVSAGDLLVHARGVLERDGLLGSGDRANLTEDELHSIRKAAKAARYLAESLPENAATAAAARQFEALQEAGGQWHDLLDIARAARRYLGKSHALTVNLAAERDRKLLAYREALPVAVSVRGSGKRRRPAKRQSPRKKQPGRAAAKAAAATAA